MDPPADEAFDRLTRLAARMLRAPIVLLSLLDGDQVVFKSACGPAGAQPLPPDMPLSRVLCRYLDDGRPALLIPDLLCEPLIADDDAARAAGVRAYLAVPMRAGHGARMGALCAVDFEPRQWSDEEVGTLLDLAEVAAAEIERRAEARRVQEKLKQREERFRSLTENAADLVAILTAGGTVDYATPSIQRMLGYSPDSLIGTSGFSLLHPSDAPEVIGSFSQVLRGATCDGGLEFRVRHQDGSWRVLQVRASNLLRDPAVEGVVVNCRDITEARQAEQDQRRLNAFLEATPDFVATFDPHGRALSINRAFRQVLGIEVGADLSSVNLPDLYPHEVTERLRHEGIPTAIRDGVWSGETWLVGADGAETPISQVILAHKASDGTVEFLSTLGRDITERQRAEAALRRSEEHFRSLIENSTDVITLMDAEGRIMYESPSLERVLGYRPEEMIGRNAFSLIHPDDLAAARATFAAGVKQPAAEEPMTLRLRHRDGAWRVLEVRGNNLLHDPAVAGVVVNSRDVTERAEAEEAVRRSEARVRAIFEGAAIGIALCDVQGRIVQANPALGVMLGYGAEELHDLTFRDLTHPEDQEIGMKLVRELFAGERELFQLEKRYLHRDGRVVYGSLTVSLIRDSSGNPQFSVGMVEDVTEQRKTEQALRESQQQLLQSQKMEAVGRLAGGVAHDFNNLLTAIKGFTELLLLDTEESDPRWGFASEIQSAANRAASLTRQLLAFSRKQVLQPKVLDLNTSVSGMQTMLQRLIGEHVELTTEPNAALGRVKADPGQIEQVLLNLAVNARDAMLQGGRLAIATSNVQLAVGDLPHSWNVRPGRYVRLSVSDTGCGMSPEVRLRVFEPFFTTKEQGKGTGLGLSTVYGIVKQSGGYISVESAEGQGTTFHIFLPRVDEVVELPVERRAPAPARGNETVLLAEDEISVRVLVRRVLSRNGYRVLEAESGAGALELLEKHDGPVDLLLTDVVMPGMSGRELADRLAPRYPEMKILYMSGYTDEAIVHHGVLEPGVAFLEKPFTPEIVLRKLREVLDTPREEPVGG